MREHLTLAARALCVAIVGVLCAAGPARADKPQFTPESAETCTSPVLEQPFAGFGDDRDYVLAPGAGFEDPAMPGWDLGGGAAVEPVTDPFFIGDGDDANSLALPSGATATTPLMCVDLNFPTMRLIARSLREKQSNLVVEVMYPNAPKSKYRHWQRAKTLKADAGDGWQPTKDVRLRPKRGGKDAGWRKVALRFSSRGKHAGTWHIDDVYVDPRMK